MTRPKLDPAGPFSRIPLAPHSMRERFTPTRDVLVLCHLGVPHLDREQWSFEIDGLVERPMRLKFSDLTAYRRATIATFHQCSGNPLKPFEPTRRIANVSWTGARLAEVLRDCQPKQEAKFLWSYGADHGELGGTEHPAYVKDLPLERVQSDVLLAYELNGAPLPPEHGFPVRLVVPGFYGTNSVKWLTRITAADSRATGAFTTRWYNDPVLDADGRDSGTNVPVWSVAPESVIVSPAPAQSLERGVPVEIWGWAWADSGIAAVNVSIDAGATWLEAKVEPRVERSWQRFTLRWSPADPGPYILCSAATSHDGATQPDHGHRNAIHRVEVRVDGH